MAAEVALVRPIFKDEEEEKPVPAPPVVQAVLSARTKIELPNFLSKHLGEISGYILLLTAAIASAYGFDRLATMDGRDWNARTRGGPVWFYAEPDNRAWYEMTKNPAVLRNGRLLCIDVRTGSSYSSDTKKNQEKIVKAGECRNKINARLAELGYDPSK